jgi:hypothetical protein
MKFDEMKEDMRIREKSTGRLAIIGLKRYGRFTIVDQQGHVETFTKNNAEEWTKA